MGGVGEPEETANLKILYIVTADIPPSPCLTRKVHWIKIVSPYCFCPRPVLTPMQRADAFSALLHFPEAICFKN